jgi:hypothetical protein
MAQREYTEHKQKNGAASKIDRKCISHPTGIAEVAAIKINIQRASILMIF